MNKNLSRTVLVLVIGAMFATSMYIGLTNKDDSQIVDISGNRDVLDDINVIYQERQGFYKTKEVNISKDGLDVDDYAKGLPDSYSTSSLTINNIRKNRDVLEEAWYGSIYEDDKSIGFVNVNQNYDNLDNQKLQLIAHIRDKDLKRNKIKSYEIPLGIYLNNDIDNGYNTIPIKYNNELYIVLGIDKDPEYMDKEDGSVYGSKESLVSIYKLNLNDESSEHVLTKNIAIEGELSKISSSLSFTYKNNLYMMVERYKQTVDGKFEKRVELLSYNPDGWKSSTIALPTNIYRFDNYYTEGNNVTFIGMNYENKDSIDIYKTTINLDTNEILSNNEKYSIKKQDTNYDYTMNQVRILNGKIYLIFRSWEEEKNTGNYEYSPSSAQKEHVYVLDEKTKETLYIGKVYEGNNHVNPIIVKEEEM